MRVFLNQYRLLLISISLFFLLSISACKLKKDSQESSIPQGKGKLSLRVQWENQHTRQLTPVLDCEKSHVNTIEVKVYDQKDNVIATGGPWLCSDHKGSVVNIDPGTVRVVLMAKDPDKKMVYWGERKDVTVSKGKTEVAEISAQLFIPNIKNGSNNMVLAKPKLEWLEVKGASQFSVHISKDKDMKDAKSVTFGSNHLSYEPPNLEEETNYYWQIFATDVSDNISRGSDIGSFTTLGTPKATYPLDNADLLKCKADLKWDKVEKCNGYVVEVSEFFDMKDPVIQETVETTSFKAFGLNDSQTYYWRVLAKDSYGNLGKPSYKRDFVTRKTITLSNIPPSTAGSKPKNMLEVGGQIFFAGADENHGNELWVTTGKRENARLVKDINPKHRHSNPKNFTALNGRLIFTAKKDKYGRELWVSDGTETGTRMIKDIMKPGGSMPDLLTRIDGKNSGSGLIYFAATSKKHGRELWKTDGTASGTRLAANIYPDDEDDENGRSSNPKYLTAVDDILFFTAKNKKNGVELWKYHNKKARLVKDIYPNKETDDKVFSSSPKHLTTVGNALFFTAKNGKHGYELWRCDASNPFKLKTAMVKNIYPGGKSAHPENLSSLYGELYFSASDGENGRELWKSDGSKEGTFMIADINPGMDSSHPSQMIAYKGQVYFRAENDTYGSEIWITDGSKESASLFADIHKGVVGSDPSIFSVMDETLYFKANDGHHGKELWVTNGTRSGTRLFKDIWSGPKSGNPTDLTQIQNGEKIIFQANDGFYGEELWISDGSKENTFLVSDINQKRMGNSHYPLAVAGKSLFFTAMDADTGVELWKSDGSLKGTKQVKDIHPNGSSYPKDFTVYNDALYFFADNGTISLWKSDGTKEGTSLIHPFLNSKNQWPYALKRAGNSLFFVAPDNIRGTELWVSSGTAESTRLIDIAPDGKSSSPNFLLPMGDHIYFAATDGMDGVELWKSDGTIDGTVLVNDIHPKGSSYPRDLVALNDHQFFFLANDGKKDGLYRTDIQNNTTKRIKIFNNCKNLNVVRGRLYFLSTGGGKISLWRSDGTGEKTKKIFTFSKMETQLFGQKTIFTIGNFKRINDTIFFIARSENGNQPVGEREVRCDLWKTIHKSKRTVKVISQVDKDGSMLSEKMVVYNDNLLLKGYEPTTGYKLWKSDGTKKGTKIITDFDYDRSEIFIPRQLTLYDSSLFFNGFDEENGDQLRVYCP